MAVVYYDIGASRLVVDHVNAFQAFAVDFFPEDRAAHDTVAEHSEFEERQCNTLGEEYFAYFGRDACKRIPDNSDDNVLEKGRPLHEG